MREILPDYAFRDQRLGIEVEYMPLESNLCARYARLQSEKLFNHKFNQGHAWDLPYLNAFTFYHEGILMPGTIILCHNPESEYRTSNGKIRNLDMHGNPIEDTHVVTYIGESSDLERVFIQQYRDRQWTFTNKEFEKFKLTPKKIILPIQN